MPPNVSSLPHAGAGIANSLRTVAGGDRRQHLTARADRSEDAAQAASSADRPFRAGTDIFAAAGARRSDVHRCRCRCPASTIDTSVTAPAATVTVRLTRMKSTAET